MPRFFVHLLKVLLLCFEQETQCCSAGRARYGTAAKEPFLWEQFRLVTMSDAFPSSLSRPLCTLSHRCDSYPDQDGQDANNAAIDYQRSQGAANGASQLRRVRPRLSYNCLGSLPKEAYTSALAAHAEAAEHPLTVRSLGSILCISFTPGRVPTRCSTAMYALEYRPIPLTYT